MAIENIDLICEIAIGAGMEIMDVYKKDFTVEYKDDKSPLTEADIRANNYITRELNKLTPDIPILSEESKMIPYSERKFWNSFWLVDPVDGTKEFIKKSDEFTVNIALIQKGKPVLGVVYAPALDELYFGSTTHAATKKQNQVTKKLPLKKEDDSIIKVVASKSHLTPETSAFIEKIAQESGKKTELTSRGSSLKLCMVAEGSAHIYPRLGPTMEWDTAAAHAVVNAAGKRVIATDGINETGELLYNKEDLLNPWFIVK